MMKTFTLISVLFGFVALKANPIHEKPYRNSDGSYNLFVEIPAGTQQKWEVNKRSGKLEWEEKAGKKRIVEFLPYPGNYGFIPSTLAGDGDPVDVITLDAEENRGKFLKVRIIGAMDFKDGNQEDIKFIGVDPEGVFKSVESIEQLMFKHPAVLEILRSWFVNCKGSGKMAPQKYLNLNQARGMISIAHAQWKSDIKQ